MEVIRAVVAAAADIVALEHVQHFQRDEPLGVRWQLVDLVAAVGGADRIDPVGAVRREVGGDQEAATLLHVGRDGGADCTAVNGSGAVACDLLERLRQIAVLKDLSRPRSAAARKKHGGGSVIQPRRRRAPLRANDLGHRKPIARVADGRPERRGEADGAVLLEQFRPPGDRAGHRDRIHTVGRYRRDALIEQRVGVGIGAGAAARIESAQHLPAPVVDDCEHIAANTGHRRLDDRQDGGRGDRGVDGIAARLENLKPGGGSQWLTGGDDAVAGQNWRTAAARVACGSVAHAEQVTSHKSQGTSTSTKSTRPKPPL
jgi:hypothetical protein